MSVFPLIDAHDISSLVCAGVVLRCVQCTQHTLRCVQNKSVPEYATLFFCVHVMYSEYMLGQANERNTVRNECCVQCCVHTVRDGLRAELIYHEKNSSNLAVKNANHKLKNRHHLQIENLT